METTEKTPAKKPIIEVCHGPKCSDFGGRELSKELDALGIESTAGDCRSQCPHAPVVFIQDRMTIKADIEKVSDRIQQLSKK